MAELVTATEPSCVPFQELLGEDGPARKYCRTNRRTSPQVLVLIPSLRNLLSWSAHAVLRK